MINVALGSRTAENDLRRSQLFCNALSVETEILSGSPETALGQMDVLAKK